MPDKAQELRDLADRVATEHSVSENLAATVSAAAAPFLNAGRSSGGVRASDLGSTDYVLHLVDRIVPGWSIHLRGLALEANGRWHCALRPSESNDEDEVVAQAEGPALANTVLAALLRLAAYRADRAL